jgi:hypothetical protein
MRNTKRHEFSRITTNQIRILFVKIRADSCGFVFCLLGCVSPLLVLSALASPAFCEDLIIKLPDKSRINVATAIERDSAVNVGGTIDGNKATFANLRPDTPYDLAIETVDGTLYCGADLSWCDPTPADPQAEPLGDDDREAIRAIVQDVLGFADKPKIAILQGTHDRAVALVDLTRGKDFNGNKGDEVIWRVEVWFFKWENGGWERVADQSRLLRRERFESTAAYQKETGRVRWIPALGGMQLPKGSGPVTVTVGEKITPPTTTESNSPADTRPGNLPPPP